LNRATTTLITGFPALRARRILSEVARRTPGGDLVALVHPSRLSEAQAVADELGFAPGGRLELLAGDPASIDFGLSGRAYLELAARTRFVHAAYSIIDPDAGAVVLEKLNVGAARELAELSRVASRLERLVLYSSVFVSGDRNGRVREHELEAGQSFRNPAERSLAIAERVVRQSGVPLTVIRAGHLLGDSETGGIDRPSAPYLCVGLMLSTPPDAPLPLPPFAVATVPVTPVDYLARAGAAAPDVLPPGRTVHAIDPEPLTLGRFVELLAEQLGRRLDTGFNPGAMTRALIGNAAARLLPKSRRDVLETLATSGDYETDGAAELAAHGGPSCPPLTDYLGRIIEHVRLRLESGALEVKGRDDPPFLVA
jgi:thioester reductase-like protein